MTVGIPKNLGHIWIGPKPAPEAWMQSWPDLHPTWDYRIYDNDFLRTYPFRTRRLINEYFWRGEYAGVQDLMRYEILYAFGGFMADADAVCQHPVDELVQAPHAYTVYDRAEEAGRGVSPFLASVPQHPLIGTVIDRLAALEPWELRKPFHSTGNLFLMRLINEMQDRTLTIWPSHYFVPWHHSKPDDVYDGPDTVYAEQKWGTATYSYNSEAVAGARRLSREELRDRTAELCRALRDDLQPGLVGDPPEEADPAYDRAGSHPSAWQEAISDPDWDWRLASLNETVMTSLEAIGAPAVINGNGFYRHKQSHRLTESPFMSATAALRQRVAAYVSGATSVLQIGVDAGHMLLLQKTVTPDARVVAFDACKQIIRGSAACDVYTPAVMDWFNVHFAEEVTFLTGRPARALAKFHARMPEFRADLLHINGIDVNFLKSFGASLPMLSDDGLIVIQDRDAASVKARVAQLQMIGETGWPVEMTDFGNRAGGLAVLRAQKVTLAGDSATGAAAQ